MENIVTIRNLEGGRRLGWLTCLCLTSTQRETKAGTQAKEEARNKNRDLGGVLLTCLFFMFSYPTKSHMYKGGTMPSGHGLLISIIKQKKCSHRLIYRSVIWWHFLNWNSFFPENSSFLTKLDTSQNKTALTVNWEHIAQYIEDRNKWMFNNINNAWLI